MKLRWNRLLIIPLLIGLIGLWLLWPHSKPSAEWYNEGWLYRKKITVTNNTSTESNKYVTLSSIDTSDNTRFQSDCGDIRFVKANGEILPYYIVSGCASASTSFHINFDTLVAGAQDIYMYYGNPTVSNGFQTVDFSSAATNASIGSPATEENSPGPVSYWKFDEGIDNTCADGANDACDSTPQQNDLLLSGASWKSEESCVSGKCLQFDGTNDSIGKAGGTNNQAQFVKECSNSGTNISGGVNLNVTCSTTAGDLVVVMLQTNQGPTRTYSVTDSGGNTYTECTDCRHQTTAIQNTGELWYSLTSSGATSIGVSGSSSSSLSVSVVEFSGIASNPFDQWAMDSNDTNTTNNPASGFTQGDTAYANEVAVGYMGITASTTLSGLVSGWTYNTTQTGSATSIKSGYQILNTSQSLEIGGTAGTNQRWTSALATFKANSSTAGDPELDAGTGSFTISGWFKHSATITGTDTIISRADGVNGIGYKLYYDATNGVCFGIDDVAGSFPTDSACTTNSYADNQWHHIAGVKSGTSSITLYIDGHSVAQDTAITSASITGNASPLKIGIDADGSSNPWDGFIDEIKFYNYARTASQIQNDAVRPNGQTSKGNGSILGQGSNDYLTKGLIGYWKMDESAADTCAGGTNDACDSSGNLNDGAWTNGATSTTTAVFGRAATFDGTNDTIVITDNDSLSPSDITISSWIKMTALPSSTGQDHMIMRKSHSSSPFNAVHWYVRQTDNKLRFEWYDSTGASNNLTGSTALTAGTWYHVAVSKSGTTAKIFINGILDASSSSFTLSTYNSSGPLRIGSNGSSSNFYGQIDEVRLYNRGLEPREINALYKWGPGPTVYYDLNENVGISTVYDKSGSGLSGSMSGGIIASAWVSGKFGSALELDGVNDYLNLSNSATNANINESQGTISFWYKMNGGLGGVYRELLQLRRSDDNDAMEFYLQSTTSALRFEYSNSGSINRITGSAPTVGTWYHVAAVWRTDGTTELYVNGVSVGTTASYSLIDTQIDRLYIGADNGTDTDTPATFDDIKIYNYARTPAQIIEDMNGGHPIGGSPVGSQVGYWKFDEGALNTCTNGTDDFCDSSINANDLAFSGTTGGITLSGKFNKAFDGNGARWASRADDADFDFAAADDFTLSTWIKTDGTASGTQYILNKSSATSQGYGIYGSSSGKVVFAIDSDTTWTPTDQAQSTTNVFDQAWHYIAARKTGTSKIDIFVDGKLEGSDTSLGATGSLSNAVALYIGDRDGTDNGDEFNGDVDEVKIYRAALTDDQIKLDFNQGQSTVMGASSTASDGVTVDNSANRAFCIPGDTTTCNPPVGWWKLDEGQGTTTYDASSNLLNGSITSANWTTGVKGKGLTVGTGKYITVSDNSLIKPTSAITVETWFRSTDITTSQRIISKKNTTGYRLALSTSTCTSSSALCFLLRIGGVDQSVVYSRTNLSNNKWYHVAGTYDGVNMNLYVNGTLVSTLPMTGAIQQGTQPLCLGTESAASDCTGGSPLLGDIDNVMIYDYARTPGQIAWDYNNGGPAAWYRFDECQGTTAYDSAPNSNYSAAGYNGSITIGATGSNTSAGTCTGAATEAWKNGVNGKIKSSMSFDGTNDYVSITDSTGSVFDFGSTQQLTLSAWIKPTSLPSGGNYATIVGKPGASTNGYYAQISSSGALEFCAGSSVAIGCYTSTQSPVTTGSWQHIAYTFTIGDSTTIKIYYNGKLYTGSWSGSGNNIPDADNANVMIGASAATAENFSGQIDDVRIYRYALTDRQIKTVINNSSAVNFAPITGSP